MKSFLNKKAMTLVELIIGITISAVLILIVSFFVVNSIDDLNKTTNRTNSIDNWFTFKDKMNRNIRWWYNNIFIFWTWTTTNNSILLVNDSWTDWILYSVINYETKKIQKDYVCWDNFIWYRLISQSELNDINTNSWVIYDYTFFNDKIYSWMRVKDFRWEKYNDWDILDIYVSIINREDDWNFWVNFNDLHLDSSDILEFNLDF